MSEFEEAKLDDALRTYLSRELDGQLGRAEAAFLCQAGPMEQDHAVAIPLPTRTRLWWAPLAGSIAAVIAIAGGVAVLHRTPKSQPRITQVTPSTQPAADVEQTYSETIDVRTVDEGTVVLDNQGPARQFRREVIEHVEWFDPAANQRIQIDIPSEEVVLVGMNAY